MRYIFALVVSALLSLPAHAQTANCVCVAPGCKIASDPFPPPTAVQPVTCNVLKSGVSIASGPAVPSTTIPTGNATICQPASGNYNPGTPGSVSCLVTIPAQTLGNVTLVMTATNSAGVTAASSPFTFVNVASLSTLPPVPTIYGVVP